MNSVVDYGGSKAFSRQDLTFGPQNVVSKAIEVNVFNLLPPTPGTEGPTAGTLLQCGPGTNNINLFTLCYYEISLCLG